MSAYVCTTCGETHSGLPALAFEGPSNWLAATDEERALDWKNGSDFATFRRTDYYIRCVLSIPVIDSDEVLEFGVWVTLSPDNFERYVETFDDNDQSKLGAMFGWFGNTLAGYEDTFALKCKVHPQNANQRPLIELEPTKHPLSVDQRNGVTIEQVLAYHHAHGAL
jgi:hypothetical protein